MGFKQVIDTLLTSLKAASGAPWGTNVRMFSATEFVQLAGANVGNPVAVTWPVLMVIGPEIAEDKRRRAPFQYEVLSRNNGAGTAQVRDLPEYFNLEFLVRFQSRVGTAPTGLTAAEQMLLAVEAFEKWRRATPKIEGCDLFSRATMNPGTAQRFTPADIREATARLLLRHVPLYPGDPRTVDTATTFDVVVTPGSG